MSKIQRAPVELSGVQDGVQMKVKMVHTTFYDKDKKMGQQLMDCSMKASWSTGTLSVGFTLKGKHQSVCVRLDEVIALLKEAADYHKENDQKPED